MEAEGQSKMPQAAHAAHLDRGCPALIDGGSGDNRRLTNERDRSEATVQLLLLNTASSLLCAIIIMAYPNSYSCICICSHMYMYSIFIYNKLLVKAQEQKAHQR